jgi:hypothetical protein
MYEMSQVKEMTEFHCAICKDAIRFDPTDGSTYENRTPEEQFFGMQLTTYRVAHITGNDRHINTVIVDHEGFYRGHKDAFSEKVRVVDTHIDRVFWPVAEERRTLSIHPHIDMAILVDLQEYWVMELVNTIGLRALEMARLITERIDEVRQVYEAVPDNLAVTIADQEVRVWMSGSRMVSVRMKTPAAYAAVDNLAREILRVDSGEVVPDKRLLTLAFHAIGATPKLERDCIVRLLRDNLFFALIDFPYPFRVPDIVGRLKSRFPAAESFLTPLLRGRETIIDLLEQGYIEQLPMVIDMIDYVERRGLLG